MTVLGLLHVELYPAHYAKIDMVFPVAQRSVADGKNLIGLSAGQDEGMSVEYPRDFPS